MSDTVERHTVDRKTISWIRDRFNKNGRMNCRDILDLIEYIDQLEKWQTTPHPLYQAPDGN